MLCCVDENDEPHASVTKPTTSHAPTTPERVPQEPWERDFRIPAFAHPESYRVLLHPDLTTGQFSGTVDVLVNVTDLAHHLVLHIHGLTVTIAGACSPRVIY